jgi:hypothetical protein
MISVPYASSGQELGETRLEMTRDLMRIHLENAINKCKHLKGKYYVLFHTKPFPENLQNCAFKVKGVLVGTEKKKIKQQVIYGIPIKPHMMLSTLLFGVNNDTGEITIEWALPGDWPTWAVGGTNEPIPETIASIKESGIQYHYADFLPD